MTDEKNVYVWNAMIGGLSQMGLWGKSLELYASLKSQDAEVGSATFSSLLTACSYGEELGFGEMVHGDVIKTGFELNPYVSTSLLSMYGKCASVGGAVKVFTGAPDKTTELYNAMIATYTGNGFAEEALHVYIDMHCINARLDSFTVSNILAACALISLHDFGRTIHGQLIKRPGLSNFLVLSSLLTMYMKCGNTEDASAVFNSIAERDVVVWGSVIAGLCQNKKVINALGLLKQMHMQGLKPDSAIIAAIAVACVRLEYIDLGCQTHGYAIKSGMESDAFVASVLIDMYAKSGLLESATKVFFNIPHKNLVLWNSMVAGFSRHGEIDSCLRTFTQMHHVGMTPDSISITNLLVAASLSAALSKGKMIHGYQVRNGIKRDPHVDNALLDMYIKCGCLSYAHHIFERMPVRTTVSWNTMISGYGSHGQCHKAISLFEKMQRSEVAPDAITFLALITSCSHSGLTEGLKFFSLMSTKYGVLPTIEHYANVVDLLGRAGHIHEAYHFIKNLPFDGVDASAWLCLLSACRAHGNIEIGEVAANHLLKLEPEREDGGGHIQLWNLYGEGRLLEKAATVRVRMKKEGLKKQPGCSWVEVKDNVEVFFSGDSSSQLNLEIHDMLYCLRRNMRDEDVSF
ncbi:hypothetical protein Taro_019624 [Colocasia esculenta]|uniref:Pentatricopeptide repeat-containing protein n=1 Tax=Colocasia esculenta TaxID=4460 RepID=A0A843UUE0_COLES|nr:hypothetical protein [Colocasia esculenta]